MPAFLKTQKDEELWSKAKELAADQGHEKDWAYVTGIYKKMKGGKVGKVGSKRYSSYRALNREVVAMGLDYSKLVRTFKTVTSITDPLVDEDFIEDLIVFFAKEPSFWRAFVTEVNQARSEFSSFEIDD